MVLFRDEWLGQQLGVIESLANRDNRTKKLENTITKNEELLDKNHVSQLTEEF